MHKQIIAVDFDGTLCENKWPEIGEPNTELIGYLIMMQKTVGAKIILWTCRIGEMLDRAVNWCSEHGLEFDTVNENLPHIIERFGSDTRKIFANMYIDDRNFWYDDKSPKKILYLCDLTDSQQLQNGLMGLNGESGECIDILKKYLFQGHDLDKAHIAKELGDVAWYLAVSAQALGFDLETILQMNVEKLKARYPHGFDAGHSQHRSSGDI